MPIGESIIEAKTILENEGIVAIPTETVYGLAANALNENAILKVYEAKKRPKFDPLIVHIGHINQIQKYASLTPKLNKLAQEFWPGPLTLLLKKNENISDLVTAGSQRVAIRIPKHHLTSQLLNLLAFPLVAPSANTFGYVSPTSALHVEENLGSKIDYILNGGSTEIGLESTIISEENNKIIIHRLGAISIEEIENFMNEKIELQIQNNSNPSAPGMLDKHYSPKCKLLPYLPNESPDPNSSIIWYGPNEPEGYDEILNLSKDSNLNEAAASLFSALRSLDKSNKNLAYVKFVPETGLGRAINDRLKRAIRN